MNTVNLFIDKRLVAFVSLLIAGLFAACSEDEGVAPDKNSPPEVVFTVAAVAFPHSSDHTLSVNATDPDGDNVSVLWEITRGVLTASQQGNPSINWKTPTTTGRDTITVTASDGKGGTTTLVETILVGTAKPSGISSSQIWRAIDSPFIVQPAGGQPVRFLIFPNATLTVEEGCELLIDAEDLEVFLEGTLRANGTQQSPVAIRPNIRHPQPGHWQGITANPNSSVPRIELTYTDLLYATEAAKTTTGGEIVLDGCRVMFSGEAGVLHQSSGSLSVVNSIITNNVKSGIRINSASNLNLPPTVVISNDSIAVNGDVSGATPYVDQAAIYIEMPDTFATSDIQITNNEISRNAFPAIQLVGASRPDIRYNAIFSNELGKTTQRYNIRLDDGFGGGVSGMIDARDNYWGAPFTNPAVDSVLIRQMIRDSEDVGSISVRVAIDPWLNAKP